MKKSLLTLLLALCVSIFTFAQTTFNLTQNINLPLPNGDAPYNIASGFIDGDTFADIVVGTDVGGSVYWLKNDGNAYPVTFTIQTVITTALPSVGGVAIADLDNDGDNDIIASSYTSDKVTWFENDGSGNFGAGQDISTSVNGAGQIYVRTIDAGVTPDVAVSAYDGNEVVWFSNDGAGNFGAKNIIDNTLVNPGAFAMTDIDNDGDVDAVIGNSVNFGTPNDSSIKMFYNDGTGSFTADVNQVATNTKDYIFSIMIGDADGDTNLDLLVTDLVGTASWYKRTPVGPGEATYAENMITTSIVNPACLALEDLDGDTLLDFVLSSGTSGAGNDIVWYRNNGAGFDAEVVIDDTQSQAYTFTFFDFNNDTDLDIASVAYNQDRVNIFDNQLVPLSINDFNINTVGIYPNPSATKIYFKGLENESITAVSVFDMLGKTVLRDSIIIQNGLDISKLQTGVYFLKIEDYGQTFKIIKQ